MLIRFIQGAAFAFLLGASSARAVTLHLHVNHVADGAPLILDSLRYPAKTGETFSVTRASYLLSGFALKKADGTWLEIEDSIAWMDAARRRSDAAFKNIPKGRYVALRFHLGLDVKTNAAPAAGYAPDHPLNPNVNGLHWSMLGGYIFLALEGNWTQGAGKPVGYAYHLARDANRTRIILPGEFDLSGDATASITFDPTAVIRGPRLVSFSQQGSSTHSQEGDPIAAAMAANLPAAFALDSETSRVPALSRATPIKPVDLPPTFTPYKFTMSDSFPLPALPRDNPLIVERVELGERLFNDPALSRDHTISCATCHPQAAAFADPQRFSVGVDGRTGSRQSMPLLNLAWKSSFFWDGRTPSLRAQALLPIEDHLEMDEKLENVVAKLQKTSAADFRRAFGSTQVTAERIGLAIENYLLTLTSHDSRFDRVMRGQDKLSPQEQRGFELFMMEREPRMGSMGADCFHCHGGALFTDHQFRNNGLAIDAADLGRAKVTGVSIDRGAFATPSLRNIALTAPYMHDGRFATLEAVLDHYSEGVERTDTLDPNLAKHPDGGLHLTAEEKAAVIAFLKTLTDRRFEKAAVK
jgi:cytochrome c peroxidase